MRHFKYMLMAGLSGAGLFWSSAAVAQAISPSRTDSFVPAKLEVLESRCPSLPALPPVSKDPGNVQVMGLGLFAPIVSGLLGDVATAALNSAAGALEEAAKARGTGAEGVGAFEFYDVKVDSKSVTVLPFGKIACLKLTTSPRVSPGPKGAVSTKPAISVEVEIIRMRDGFTVRPVRIEYARPLAGAPTKAAKAELHVEFSIPAANQNGTAGSTVFALARIMLPPMAPGETIWTAADLGASSEVLAFRPEASSLNGIRLQIQPYEQLGQKQTDLSLLVLQRATLLGAKVNAGGDVEFPPRADCKDCDDAELEKLAIKGLADDKKPQLKAIDERLAAAEVAFGEAKLRAQALDLKSVPTAVGSTTAKVRFLVIKDENRFLMAIANALKTRAPAVGTAVTQTINPEKKPSWTALNSTHELAEARVDRARSKLAAARLGGDQTVIETAETEFLNARLDLNLAAAALDLPAPHPNPSIHD